MRGSLERSRDDRAHVQHDTLAHDHDDRATPLSGTQLPPLPPEAAPGATTGPEQWYVVIERLRAAMDRLQTEYPAIPMLVAGDLNESLVGKTVMSGLARRKLQQLLDDFRLVSYLAELPSAVPDCNAIDHLCGPGRSFEVTHWAAPPVPGRSKLTTDHHGYVVELAT